MILCICGAFCACSDDDKGISPDEAQKVFTGDEAYINVLLADAGSLSRAETEEPGYEYGIANEHAVKNAFFYFYDANGVFVAEGSAWNGGSAQTGDPAGNIEFNSTNVVVLKGLTKKNYPKYMVTVLNRPTDFVYGGTLDNMLTALSSSSTVGITTQNDNTDYFVMSTTSFKHDDADNLAGKYFVTEVKNENFSPEPINDGLNSGNYVKVYVERLAAKVTLNVDETQLRPVTITVGNEDKTFYQIEATVAGAGNDDDATAGNTGQIASEDLYVELLGWKLNATAKKSNIVKNIKESWTDTELGFVWNKPLDFRSFWGMSFNYDKGNYPESAGNLYDQTTGVLTPNEYLDYVNLNTGLVELGKSSYCAENTNTIDIVSGNFPSAVTSVLLKARVCDSDGNALDLVRFNGVLFKKDHFFNYILSVMNAKNKLNVWVETTSPGESQKVYAQITKDYLMLENERDGKVNVQLNDVAKSATLYARTANGSGGFDYTKITDLSSINSDFATESDDATGYDGGLMYYNIPIQHLNETNKDAETGKYDGFLEANYGVVRNHHYVLTVNKLEKMGKGIFDSDEVIVPEGGDDDKETYYVGATISILSWKIVSQDVNL